MVVVVVTVVVVVVLVVVVVEVVVLVLRGISHTPYCRVEHVSSFHFPPNALVYIVMQSLFPPLLFGSPVGDLKLSLKIYTKQKTKADPFI